MYLLMHPILWADFAQAAASDHGRYERFRGVPVRMSYDIDRDPGLELHDVTDEEWAEGSPYQLIAAVLDYINRHPRIGGLSAMKDSY